MFLLMWSVQELAECPDISDVGSPYILMILPSPTLHLPPSEQAFKFSNHGADSLSLVIMSYAATKSEKTCYRFRTFSFLRYFFEVKAEIKNIFRQNFSSVTFYQ
jgi:hypothetical protein